MTDSARLHLPYLEPGQAQKEWFHNEALALIDIAVQATVAEIRNDPPAAPTDGACWIVGVAPVGAWVGQAGAIAGWTAGGWRFVVPGEGFAVWSLADRTVVRRLGGVWMLDRSPPVAVPSGGETVDAECRATVLAMLAAMQARGWLA